jgi:hypothetical protein
MEPELATSPYLESDAPLNNFPALRSILKLSSHLRLELPIGLFPSGPSIKTSREFISPTRDICPHTETSYYPPETLAHESESDILNSLSVRSVKESLEVVNYQRVSKSLWGLYCYNASSAHTVMLP